MTNEIDPVGSEVKIGSGAFPTTTILESGNYVVSWLDMVGTNEVRSQVFDPDGNPVGNEYALTQAIGYHATASLEGGGFVIIFGSGGQVRAQIFDSVGAPVGGDVLLGSSMYNTSSLAVTGLAGGGFVAAWRTDDGLAMESFSAAGASTQSFDTSFPEGSTDPSLAQSPDGSIILIADEYDSETPHSGGYADGYEVSGRIFAPNGTMLTGKFIINDSQAGSHGFPEVTMLADGGFVVTWVTGGEGAGVKAQIFDASGAAVGGNIEVSDLDPGNQANPTVEALPGGGFLIAWGDRSPSNPDDSSGGIRAQLFASDGGRVGETIQVNEQTFADETTPTIVLTSEFEAQIIYRTTGNADPSGILARTIAIPALGTSADDVIGGSAADERYAGLEGNDTINGYQGDDVLFGNEGHDYLIGQVGNDELHGGSGSDTLRGQSGDDILMGGLGHDDLFGGTDNDTLNGEGGNDRVYGNGGDDFVNGSVGDDNVFGGAGNDQVHGGHGRDVMNGHAGDDVIVGGPGNDLLVGGQGADRFLFNEGHLGGGLSASDRIKDFTPEDGDVIDFHLLDADTTTADDQAFIWIGEAEFSSAAGELRTEIIGNTTYVYGDTDGDAVADFVLFFTGQVELSEDDFIL